MSILCKLDGTELLYLSLLYSGELIVECGKVFMMGEACDPHLIVNGPYTPLSDFRLGLSCMVTS